MEGVEGPCGSRETLSKAKLDRATSRRPDVALRHWRDVFSAAEEAEAKTFLSFDIRSYPRALAHAQKLKVWPELTTEGVAYLK